MNRNDKLIKLAISSFIVVIAFIFSKMEIIQLPFGGSVNLLSMLIISLPGYLFGLKYGFIAAGTFSVLKCVFAGYAINIASIIFDYFLSYIVFGISGFAYKKKLSIFIIYYIVAVTLRFIFACISGIAFFSEYCPEGMNLFLYVVMYNGSYIYLEALISILVLNIPIIKNLIMKVSKKYV